MQFKAKTTEEAIKDGLAFLEITEEQADIKIIEEPIKGLFGRVKTEAIVEITEKKEKKEENKTCEEDKEKEEKFLKTILSYLEIPAEIEWGEKEGKEVLTLKTEQSSALIGYRGEVLDALQVLVTAVKNNGKKEYTKVTLDCENYRDKREETLINLAHKLEEKATSLRREVRLESMCAYERRIIHTALAESQTVTTRSDGKDPDRYVVIVPNDLDEFSKPYNAGRNDKQRRNGRTGGQKNFKKGRNDKRRTSSSTESKRVAPSGFGTYLGNSLKDKL